MKTDSQLMNELAISNGLLTLLSPEDSMSQKVLLLEMYRDIVALCDKHELVYMMGGGTCLGAIRHQGYIPWDDDLDLMMPRDSYEKLILCLAKGELGDLYEYDCPSANRDCKYPFLKVYRKDTLDVEIISETAPGPNGIFIDIFPMDYAPKNKIARKVKGFFSDLLHAVCSSVLYTEYPSRLYKDFMMQSKEGKVRYFQRFVLGKFFGIIPHRKWVWWFDQYNANGEDTGYLTIPTGRKHYIGECRPTSVYLPIRMAMFEGLEVNVPNDVHVYLTSMYKNYMEVPPVEKRERHFVYKFKLPEE